MLNDPRVHTYVEDGRNFLLKTPRQSMRDTLMARWRQTGADLEKNPMPSFYAVAYDQRVDASLDLVVRGLPHDVRERVRATNGRVD